MDATLSPALGETGTVKFVEEQVIRRRGKGFVERFFFQFVHQQVSGVGERINRQIDLIHDTGTRSILQKLASPFLFAAGTVVVVAAAVAATIAVAAAGVVVAVIAAVSIIL